MPRALSHVGREEVSFNVRNPSSLLKKLSKSTLSHKGKPLAG
jgi:hypothetical protein